VSHDVTVIHTYLTERLVRVNWVLGPVLDVLNITSRNQPLGVRTMGNDPQEVSQMGVAFMQGLKGTTIECSLAHRG